MTIDGVAGIAFRLDGVLIDTVHVGYSVWHHEFLREGLHLPVDYWGDLLERHPLADCDRLVLDLLCRRSVDLDGNRDDILDRVRRRRRRLETAQRLRPSVDSWLREGADLGLRLFAVSDHAADHLEAHLSRLGIGHLFERVFSFAGSDGYRDVVRHAKVPGSALVAVEDAPAGIRAARAAGIRCVASPHKVSVHHLPSGPDMVIAEPPWIDLSGALSGLPGPPRDHAHRAPGGDAPGGDAARRVAASLGALALGDAIGKVVNKRSVNQFEPDTADLLTRLESGADPPPDTVFTGCVTDDTVLLLALVDCVLADGRVRRDGYERALRAVNPRGGRQIYRLRADASELFVAPDGNTNGCVPRCAAVAYTTPSTRLGDLSYDALKVATLTHGGPEALVAALLFAVITAAAVDGEPVRSIRERLPGLYAPLTRLAGGGGDICDLIQSNMDRLDRVDSPEIYADLLEGAVGMAMAARSSAVSAICLGLSGFPLPRTLAVLMRRQAHWDLDSTAAIYAGLAGALQPDEVPAAWIARVEAHSGRDFGQLAGALIALRGG